MKLSRKSFSIILLVCLTISAGVYAAYALGFFPSKAEAAPELQTTTVRTGDLLVLVTASGNVQPVSEVALSFRTGGLLAEMDVVVGDSVEAGQGLARLDDTAARLQLEQARINLDALLSPSAVIEAELAVLSAQKTLADANDRLIYYELTQIERDLTEASARLAEQKLQEAQDYAALLQKGDISDQDLGTAQGAAFDRLKQARLAVANAQFALDNTVLTAPFAGTITRVNASAGESVGASPVLVLSTQDQLVVRFYVEEGDIDKVKIGNRVKVTFEGYPNLTLEGEVYELEPAMVIIDDAPTLIAWASLPSDSPVPLFSGMSADLEIIAGEARGALLVPVAALRELTPGSYAVFVVQPDGQLKLTPVTVGLQDLTNAEIVEGLEEGDVISTGNVVTQQ